MKKYLLLIALLFAVAAGYSQATAKFYYEVYNRSIPLGISIPSGSTVLLADSGFWIQTDHVLARTDSGATLIRRGATYFHFMINNTPFFKYTTGIDSALTGLRSGACRLTNTNLWIKVNGIAKKWHYTP